MDLCRLIFVITNPPNGLVLFCSMVSVVCHHHLSGSVTLLAAGRWGASAVRRPTLHDGPVQLRPVRATSFFFAVLEPCSLAVFFSEICRRRLE